MAISKECFFERRCVIAGLFSMKDEEISEKLDSIESLISANGGRVVGRLYQRRGVSRSDKPGGTLDLDKPMSAATYIGRGKASELKELVESCNADMVVFINSLSGTQIRNISEITGCETVSVASA